MGSSPETFGTRVSTASWTLARTSTRSAAELCPAVEDFSELGGAAEQRVAQTTMEVIHREFPYLPGAAELKAPAVREKLTAAVEEAVRSEQGSLEGLDASPDVDAIVDRVVERVAELTIDVPRIVVVPTGEVVVGYDAFELDTAEIRLQPVEDSIIVHGLVDHHRQRLDSGGGVTAVDRPEDYLVRRLAEYPDIAYDDTADLLYDLAGQMVAHLRAYLPDEEAVDNVLRHHDARLAEHIHAQMKEHRWERSSGYEAKVTRGFERLRPFGATVTAGATARPFRQPVDDKQKIRRLRFTGFRRCLYPEQRFDSDTERQFAILLEDEEEELKWFRPAQGQIGIHDSAGTPYTPDFVVETAEAKYLCETKRASEMNDPGVLDKARAATLWCEHATEHAKTYGGKPWRYLLIPENAVRREATLSGLVGWALGVGR